LPSAELRQRAFSLMFGAYDEARRGVSFPEVARGRRRLDRAVAVGVDFIPLPDDA